MATAVLTMTAGCGRLPIYSHFEHISEEGWDNTDTLWFNVAASQTGSYELMLGLRLNDNFPYTRLSLTVVQTVSSTAEHSKNTHFIDFTDGEGNILGNGVSLYQYSHRLPVVRLVKGDTLRIGVSHAMSRRLLPGIADVGVTVECDEENN